MQPELTDRELVQKAQAGDEEAFATLFRRYYMTIYRLSYRLCSQPQDAEEVTQETFLRAGRGLHSFQGQSEFRSWLWKIAINCSNDRRRQRKGREDTAQAFEQEAKIEQAVVASPDAGSSEILSALDQLPPKTREAIVLTVYEELSHEEAAKVLGCSTSTVSWHVFAGKRQLKKLLTEKRRAHG